MTGLLLCREGMTRDEISAKGPLEWPRFATFASLPTHLLVSVPCPPLSPIGFVGKAPV
jgi:hypothetical protein